jgi:DNA-binding response OmpR family regulator
MDGDSKSAAPARALVIDDDELSAELLRLMLARLGVAAHVARDGVTGLQAFTNDHFKLVLVDLKLPDVDGLEVVRQLRAHSTSVSLVVVSGLSMLDDEEKQRTVGFDAFLMKPFSFEQFAEQVKPLLKKRKPKSRSGEHS